MNLKERLSRHGLALGAATILAIGSVIPAFAADTVTLTINGGVLSASIADLNLTALNYSHIQQNQTGTMVLTVDDSTGTGDGWNVTVQSSDFVYSGANNGVDILAASFALTSAATPVSTAGQAVDGTNGPKVVTATGTLDSAREVIDANAEFGSGTYTQDLGVDLTVPAQARAGTYTATLTVTEASGPDL